MVARKVDAALAAVRIGVFAAALEMEALRRAVARMALVRAGRVGTAVAVGAVDAVGMASSGAVAVADRSVHERVVAFAAVVRVRMDSPLMAERIASAVVAASCILWRGAKGDQKRRARVQAECMALVAAVARLVESSAK